MPAMGFLGLVVIWLAMMVGIIGIVVPLMPGSFAIICVAVVWAIVDGSTAAWVVVGSMAVVLAGGTIAKYVLPARALNESATPRTTMLVGIIGAVVGFFVIPVVGLLVGGLLGVFAAELKHHGGDASAAWHATVLTLQAVGLGVVVELCAGVLAVAIWTVSAFVIY